MSVQERIEAKVRAAFTPAVLEVRNESGMHDVDPGSESHFRLLIVAQSFDGQSRVQRHRAVYRVLADEMQGPVHALGLQTLTPSEFQGGGDRRVSSPPCLGGSSSGDGTPRD